MLSTEALTGIVGKFCGSELARDSDASGDLDAGCQSVIASKLGSYRDLRSVQGRYIK
jgi:hypothetical protein